MPVCVKSQFMTRVMSFCKQVLHGIHHKITISTVIFYCKAPATRSAREDFTRWWCPSVCLLVRLSVRLSVYLSPETRIQNALFSKTKQFRAMVSIDDQYEVVHGLFKEPIFGPLGWPWATANVSSPRPMPQWWRRGLIVSTHRGDIRVWSVSAFNGNFDFLASVVFPSNGAGCRGRHFTGRHLRGDIIKEGIWNVAFA